MSGWQPGEVWVYVARRALKRVTTNPQGILAHSALLFREANGAYWIVEYMDTSRVARWCADKVTVVGGGADYDVVTFGVDPTCKWTKQKRGMRAPRGKDSGQAQREMNDIMAPYRYSVPDAWFCHTAQELLRVEWGLLQINTRDSKWATLARDMVQEKTRYKGKTKEQVHSMLLEDPDYRSSIFIIGLD